MSDAADSVVRAMTDDGGFRVITAQTTLTVREAIARQGAKGVTAQRLGDLLTGAVLVRETMAPSMRAQAVVKGAGGRGSLVVDAYPDGANRALVQLPPDATELRFGEGALMQVMRSLPRGGVHQGVVEVPESGGVSNALMHYMQVSEQVASMIAVATVLDAAGDVAIAGGYIVQITPEVREGPLMLMGERLVDFADIHDRMRDERPSPDALIGEILYGMEYTRLEETPLRYECKCSDVRVSLALSTLGRDEIEEIIAKGETLEVRCDYCGKTYSVAPAQLRGLLDKS